MTIFITAAARRDLRSAADYIEYQLKNPQAARRLLEDAAREIGNLEHFPLRQPLVEDRVLAAWGIRSLLVRNYLVFYTVRDTQVYILRFLYAKRQWRSILRQTPTEPQEKA